MTAVEPGGGDAPATRFRETVARSYAAFRDRTAAGRELVEFAVLGPDPEAVVLAVPRGGVPVGYELARAMGAPLHLAFVRKLPIPDSPEAGFGAVAHDGSVVLNEELVRVLRLPRDVIAAIVREVQAEVERRAREYGGTAREATFAARRVYLVDDGLASGYTMIAAAMMVRNQGPRELIVAVPVAPADSLRRTAPYFDRQYCLIRQERPPFAVASFYCRFDDLTDTEVRALLRRAAP